MAPKSPEEEQEALQSAIKASAEEAAPVEAASKTANSSSPANVATPPGETPGKMAKEKNAKENAEEKRKKKGCQQRHRVELNPLKTETDLRSLWNSENHTKEQACEVLAKLVDSRHITGKHFEHSALVQDIMVFLKERAEREGVRKVLKRCVDALCFWSAAGVLQRKPGQDTPLTEAKSRSPPAVRPVRKLQRGARNLLLRSLIVLSFVAASCAGIVPAVQTDLLASFAPSSRLPVCANGPQSSFEEGSILSQDSLSGWEAAIAALVTALVCSAGLGCARPWKMQPQASSYCSSNHIDRENTEDGIAPPTPPPSP